MVSKILKAPQGLEAFLGVLIVEAMRTGELLNIEPIELKFPCKSVVSPRRYRYCCITQRPNTGVVLPRSDVIVTMRAQTEAPLDMQCKDKFLPQSVKASDGASAKGITAKMFNKEACNVLRVVYLPPPQPPPVSEGSEEGSSPRGSVSDNGNANGSDLASVTRSLVGSRDKSSENRTLISKLTDEKNAAIQQCNKLREELKLRQELELFRWSKGGVSFVFVIIVALLSITLGYLLKRT
ncbi:hypothetical protein SAY87_020541 [Trapa incisa]|uniref:MSP domain-containing protein n=1 Tax=Trapa incisa TaxID=236973 RepID=A0AAN7PPP5_9MYRT|nr:hypothetical protein SAY87_020541 [Trapa incisa]